MAVYLGSNKVGVTKELGTDRLQWKCDNMKSLSSEFYNYLGADIPVLKGLDTSKVTNMSSLFKYCTDLTSLDLSSFDTSEVTNMIQMFDRCSKLTELNLSNFNTSKVTNMSYMFQDCEKLTSLDISNFDTSKVTTMNQMFYNVQLVETISNINLINVTNLSSMFYLCKSLKNLTIYNIKKTLQIGSGSGTGSFDWGILLTLDSLVHTIQQLWDLTGSTSQTLTMSTASKNLIANVYVKLVEPTQEQIEADPYITNKKPCVVCGSTDEGAMTITEYATSKNWAIA